MVRARLILRYGRWLGCLSGLVMELPHVAALARLTALLQPGMLEWRRGEILNLECGLHGRVPAGSELGGVLRDEGVRAVVHRDPGRGSPGLRATAQVSGLFFARVSSATDVSGAAPAPPGYIRDTAAPCYLRRDGHPGRQSHLHTLSARALHRSVRFDTLGPALLP